MYVMGDGPQVRQNNSTEYSARVCTARICHKRMALPAAAGRDRDAGCIVLFVLLMLCVVVSGFCAERSRAETTAEIQLVRVDVMGHRSHVLSKATRHNTVRICHTRMVLPAAAGRGRVVRCSQFVIVCSVHCCCRCCASLWVMISPQKKISTEYAR